MILAIFHRIAIRPMDETLRQPAVASDNCLYALDYSLVLYFTGAMEPLIQSQQCVYRDHQIYTSTLFQRGDSSGAERSCNSYVGLCRGEESKIQKTVPTRRQDL